MEFYIKNSIYVTQHNVLMTKSTARKITVKSHCIKVTYFKLLLYDKNRESKN